MNYTQGEWKTEQNGDGISIYSEKYNGAWLMHSSDSAFDEGNCTKEEIQANMVLACCAPDLLDACEIALRELREFYNDADSEAIQKLRIVIDKATGGL